MCKGIEELAAKREARGEARGVLLTLIQLVRDGLLDLSVAAERANMSKEAFEAALAEQKQRKEVC